MFSSNRQNDLRTASTTQAMAAFMNRVYLWMMTGIGISGITAYVVANQPDMIAYIMQSRVVFFGLIIFQLVAVVALSGWVQRMSIGMASAVYALYATLVGLTFSVLFLVYTMESISSAFFTTAFAFAGLSMFGYLTKRDLGPIGSFCMMGLFGLIAVMLLALFFPSLMSNSMQLAISVLGVLIFSGLTAYDTQRIKALSFQFTSSDQARKGAIYGALILYLDFINLFLNILRLMGDRR
ncbi:MAG: Bax inhibitor-1/YccA family protein [Gammaproteobacteria bacterium]|nr:MAG: Bax inhibitor-1/YccA family protein [Gammaproteobacteria bacterium]